MKRAELEHVLRASAAITLDHSFVVIGSQAATMLADWMDFAKLHYIGELTVRCCGTNNRLTERLKQLDASAHPPARLVAWAQRRAQEAAT